MNNEWDTSAALHFRLERQLIHTKILIQYMRRCGMREKYLHGGGGAPTLTNHGARVAGLWLFQIFHFLFHKSATFSSSAILWDASTCVRILHDLPRFWAALCAIVGDGCGALGVDCDSFKILWGQRGGGGREGGGEGMVLAIMLQCSLGFFEEHLDGARGGASGEGGAGGRGRVGRSNDSFSYHETGNKLNRGRCNNQVKSGS